MSPVCSPVTTAWHDDACAETYEDVKRLIYKASHKYSHAQGLPFEEVLSAAHFVFMRAFHYKYRVKEGRKPATFSTRLHNSLNWELKDYLAKEIPHLNHAEINEELVGAEAHDPAARLRIESELSEDARAVVKLILDTPGDLSVLCHWEGVKSRKTFLRVLREHLADIGWGNQRIAESFKELRNVFAA